MGSDRLAAVYDDPPAAPRPWWLRVNRPMVLCAAALLAVGVLFIRSACSVRVGRAHELWRQMLWPWIPLGVAAHVVVASFRETIGKATNGSDNDRAFARTARLLTRPVAVASNPIGS